MKRRPKARKTLPEDREAKLEMVKRELGSFPLIKSSRKRRTRFLELRRAYLRLMPTSAPDATLCREISDGTETAGCLTSLPCGCHKKIS